MSFSLCSSLFFFSVDLFLTEKGTLLMLSVSDCRFYFNSLLMSFFHLSPLSRSFSLSLYLSAFLHRSLSLRRGAVGVKLGECDRKREVAGREMKGCVEREEKGKGDNEKLDRGSQAATRPSTSESGRMHRYAASNTGSLGGPAENVTLESVPQIPFRGLIRLSLFIPRVPVYLFFVFVLTYLWIWFDSSCY